MATNKSYEEGSLMDMATKFLSQIPELLEDDRPVGRLLALNAIIVFMLLGLIITSFLNANFK